MLFLCLDTSRYAPFALPGFTAARPDDLLDPSSAAARATRELNAEVRDHAEYNAVRDVPPPVPTVQQAIDCGALTLYACDDRR